MEANINTLQSQLERSISSYKALAPAPEDESGR
jgi:hypothetical protein